MFPPRFFVEGQARHGILPVVFHLVQEGKEYGDFAVVFFVTENGGTTWKASSVLWAKGYRPLIAVADATNWWVLVDSLSESQLYATHDAGATWTEVANVRRASQIQFVTAVDGWALTEDNGQSILLRTTDGGKNWFQVPVKRKTAWLP
ncbi:MAG: WD40/YVTN/BNR-like repeat-containing protein [Ignavibacteriales bacterium]